MVRLARATVALLALAACGGGDDAAAPPSETETTTTTTTAPPTEIDLSRPIPAGSLHGTPRPPLENTGDDYVAILESLVANFRWLTENPDPALISEIYSAGSDIHRLQTEVISELNAKNWRAADDGYRILSAEVLAPGQDSATLRLTDQLAFEQIVDERGERIGQGTAHDGAQVWTIVLAEDAFGRWHIASAELNADTAQVQL